MHTNFWRAMTPGDLVRVEQLADSVHTDHPEDPAVFAERLRLHPAGCLVLDGAQGIQGYVVAHPWRLGQPPKLDTLLGQLPATPDTFYIHDLALLPGTRGGGFGRQAVELLTQQAAQSGLATLSLVAVGPSPRFWGQAGFRPVEGPDLSSYGAAVFMVHALDPWGPARPSG